MAEAARNILEAGPADGSPGAGTQLYQSGPFARPSGNRRALCHMGIRGPVL